MQTLTRKAETAKSEASRVFADKNTHGRSQLRGKWSQPLSLIIGDRGGVKTTLEPWMG
jgi:hypothetical protein